MGIYNLDSKCCANLSQSARWALPTLEVIWGILTFVQSRVTSAGQLYAIRAMIGAAEAPVFAGVHFILGMFFITICETWTSLTLLQALGTVAQSCSKEPAFGLVHHN
jgi:hypothetical protein